MLGAGVGTLAVDDHGRGEHEPAGSGAGHRGEQDRGAQVVAAGVQRRVVEVDAEPDHRGQVADHADAAQRVVDDLRVADVAAGELEAGISGERGDAAGVDERQQRVKHPHLMTRARQRRDNVGTDKACTAGH